MRVRWTKEAAYIIPSLREKGEVRSRDVRKMVNLSIMISNFFWLEHEDSGVHILAL
jgi:hypothetical protein